MNILKSDLLSPNPKKWFSFWNFGSNPENRVPNLRKILQKIKIMRISKFASLRQPATLKSFMLKVSDKNEILYNIFSP